MCGRVVDDDVSVCVLCYASGWWWWWPGSRTSPTLFLVWGDTALTAPTSHIHRTTAVATGAGASGAGEL